MNSLRTGESCVLGVKVAGNACGRVGWQSGAVRRDSSYGGNKTTKPQDFLFSALTDVTSNKRNNKLSLCDLLLITWVSAKSFDVQ